ncbi:DUF983 domain-containing protein [Pseudovibrio exalbescens]|uniref:DUF983 domain-containing protein n=1 Tax=Pseudovibrio exalbescens TaxID=197461 RepID=A0A1U7JCS7_9HYPH|nr:DUF983 domain-containing protein [Pseudovibrio exalbescens]OKL42494.1 hypothetical protein A3843_17655 [Pseudovibrio exalbescens]
MGERNPSRSEARHAVPNPVATGLRGRCPRCGQGPLFAGFLKVRDHCETCDLSFASADSGDGPAVFVIMFIGMIVVGLMLLVEMNFQPPVWVHMALWIPLTIALALGLLRPLKGLLIVWQYTHRAAEGKLDED